MSSRTADGDVIVGGTGVGWGVCRAVGNGEGEPLGGTGVGGGGAATPADDSADAPPSRPIARAAATSAVSRGLRTAAGGPVRRRMASPGLGALQVLPEVRAEQ